MRFLPRFIKGPLALFLLAFNTIFWSLSLYPVILMKLLAPTRPLRAWSKKFLVRIGQKWIYWNSLGIKALYNTQWNVEGLELLDRHRSYLIVANHQSWVDIIALQHILNYRIPFIRFFLKQELIYIPLLGGAWWALDFPFMKRHSKAFLEAHPEKRGDDLETTRKSCRRFRNVEVSVLNFLEGTRFTKEKHAEQHSPYRHLLKPKTGGIAFVINAMGEQVHSVLDVTLFYPQGPVSFWGLLSGKLQRVDFVIKEYEIPADFIKKNYFEDEVFRQQFQRWIHGVWQTKDEWLEAATKKNLT